jgi:hypothetical protein
MRDQDFSGAPFTSPMKYRPVSSGSALPGRVAYRRYIASTCWSGLTFGCDFFWRLFIVSLSSTSRRGFGGYHRCFRTVGKWLDATFLMHLYYGTKKWPNNIVRPSRILVMHLANGSASMLVTPILIVRPRVLIMSTLVMRILLSLVMSSVGLAMFPPAIVGTASVSMLRFDGTKRQ